MDSSTIVNIFPKREITKFKLSIIAFLIIISIILTYYNKYILDRENFNRVQNHLILSLSIENIIDNFHYIVQKEVKLVEAFLEANNDCDKIKDIENILEYGYFTFVTSKKNKLIRSNKCNIEDTNLSAINNFVTNNISHEHNLLSYQIKVDSKCSLSNVLYNIPIGKLIKNIESVLTNIKNPPVFFILDEYYNEIYKFKYTNSSKKESFCSKIISPFSQEFYLCESENTQIYNQLIVALCIIALLIIINIAIKLDIINKLQMFFVRHEYYCPSNNGLNHNYNEKESKQKLDFLSRVTHELRTPLNIIITFSEMIKDEHLGPINNKKYLNYSREIYNYSNNLLLTVDNMIDSTKSKYYPFNIRKKEFSLSEMIDDILNIFSCWINEKKIQVQQNIEDNLPKVIADPNQIKRAIMNIVSNAIKFNNESGKIIVSLKKIGNNINLRIEDTGIGISKNSIISALHDLSEIKDSLNRKFDGMGIGLSLAKNLIELNGGKLNIESKENHGTTADVTFTLLKKEKN